jgi:hypothetical protein
MRISTITGSRVPADNITSLYTFALGIITGSFLIAWIGEFDATREVKGDFLRIYLALITAMLGGGIGLFASRLGDRVADRRATHRKIGAVLYRIERLLAAWDTLYDFYKHLADKHGQDPSRFQIISTVDYLDELTFLGLGRRIQITARLRPDFEDLVWSADDSEVVFAVELAYDLSEEDFERRDPRTLGDDERHKLVSDYVSKCRHGNVSDIISKLRAAHQHFVERIES